ncbi:MAG: hypothetical protein L6R28_07175 [Planctomycetes bacterium]|nr:hypothetical protein [Planctomycetota bacterium]
MITAAKLSRADHEALKRDSEAVLAFCRCLWGAQFCPEGVPVEDLKHFTAEIDKRIVGMRAVAEKYGVAQA